MATHKVKIAARLRPRLESEIDDDSVKIVHPSNDSGGSSSSTSGGSFITVANPRDPTQIFKFPCVHTKNNTLSLSLTCSSRFSSCYDQDSTQEEIFKNDVEPLIDVVYGGVVSGHSDSFHVLLAQSSPQDCYHLCVRCYVVWKDSHNARNQIRTRCYTPCRSRMPF